MCPDLAFAQVVGRHNVEPFVERIAYELRYFYQQYGQRQDEQDEHYFVHIIVVEALKVGKALGDVERYNRDEQAKRKAEAFMYELVR